jgi:hypothetical protein
MVFSFVNSIKNDVAFLPKRATHRRVEKEMSFLVLNGTKNEALFNRRQKELLIGNSYFSHLHTYLLI